MAGGVLAKSCFFTILLGLHTVCSSGTLVGFSYDAREESTTPWSTKGALFKILVANKGDYISMHLCVNQFEEKKLLKLKVTASSWLKTHILGALPKLNIDSIMVSISGHHSLLSTLASINASRKTFGVESSMRISVMFSLSNLKTLHRTHPKTLHRLMHILKNLESPIVVEALVDGEQSSGEDFVQSTIERAFSACTDLAYLDVPIILIVRSSVTPSEVEIGKFFDTVMKIFKNDSVQRRIVGLFIGISHLRQHGQKTLDWQEQLFPPLHRELLNHGRELVTAPKVTLHDTLNPITNPFTSPITIPSTNPTPAVVTVPSTNPITVFPTNPTMSPVTIPPMNPVSTPITVPATNPFLTPATTPVVPVTNPTTTPVTYPMNPPMTNPVSTYPFTPPVSTPSITPPVTVPSTVPITPAVTGQTWCVAKTGTTDAALQLALDYACGIGGADCTAIQSTGSCFNPDSLQAHASYAFNSYYQKNPVGTSCDFGGTAMLVTVNPSSATCIYPSSSSSSSSSIPSYNPASSSSGSTPGSGSGSSVLNANNPAGSNSVFGSNNPTGTVSSALCLTVTWTFLLVLLTVTCISHTIV
ncbi:unnamed protein product [Musa acuminata var. zebrina]